MAECKDVVVLIPGIMGSVLSKDGKEVWGLSAEALLRAIVSGISSVKSLKMAGDDPAIDDLGDGVTATRLFPDLHLIPGFWKIDGYSKISDYLVSEFQLIRGKNFFEFPYDWRRHNEVAARQLQTVTSKWLKTWREQSGNANAKLILVAHSMGGLVSRYYLEVLGGWKETRMLLTFGTPFRGSLNALNFLVNGLKIKAGPVVITDISEMLRSFTSVYQLLPIYPCIDEGGGRFLRVTETDKLQDLEQSRALQALAFHHKMTDSYESNKKDAAYTEGGYSLFPLVGTFQPTLQSASIKNGKCEMSTTIQDTDISGDGTVPRISAVPVGFSQDSGIAINTSHGSLQNSQEGLTNIWYKITGKEIDDLLFRGRAIRTVGGPHLSQAGIMMDDLYLANKKINVKVRSDNETESVLVKLIHSASGDIIQTHSVQLHSQDWHEVEFKAVRKGEYRLDAIIEDNCCASEACVVIDDV